MSTLLRDALEEHLQAVAPPPGDVVRARREGGRRRVRRRALAAATAVGVVVVGVAGAVRVADDAVDSVTAPDYPAYGRMDFSPGLRAYADPGREVHLGGRTFPAEDMEFLDTDATATPFGVVFYDDGRPMLLAETGQVRPLAEGAVDGDPEFHPTAKSDSRAPHVAWAVLRDGTATIVVTDLSTGDEVGSLEVECGECHDLVIEALDEGVVLYRTAEGTRGWQIGRSSTFELAGPDTAIVDLRGGTLLYDGALPSGTTPLRLLLVQAPVDATLTHDGRYVLDWSSTLQPTRAGDDPVVLEEGPSDGGLGFWAIDTDGSVLVASLDGKYPHFTVFDCEVPSGRCEDLGSMKFRSDPAFIGVDM